MTDAAIERLVDVTRIVANVAIAAAGFVFVWTIVYEFVAAVDRVDMLGYCARML